MKNAVVPYKKKLPVEYVYEFKLVDEDINLDTRAEVKDQLPDILGRALARS